MSSNNRKGNHKQSDMKDDPKIWRQFGVTKRRLARFLTVLAANAANAINNLGVGPCHGRGRRFDPDQVHQSPPSY